MTAIPPIDPVKGMTEETIRRLVGTFYARPEGWGFEADLQQALAHRWSGHLAIMVDF